MHRPTEGNIEQATVVRLLRKMPPIAWQHENPFTFQTLRFVHGAQRFFCRSRAQKTTPARNLRVALAHVRRAMTSLAA